MLPQQCQVSTVSNIGWREENEDAFLVKFLSSNVALFGVFDGHSGTNNLIAGAEISLFAKQNFP